MRRTYLALISAVLAICGAIGIVAVSSAGESDPAPEKRAAEFKPKDIKGKWTGSWTNNLFGSTGDILANVTVNGKKFTPLVDFSGNVLSCPDPPADSVTVKPKNSNDKWNEDGFKIKDASEAFGDDFKFKFEDKGSKVTASGTSPCDPSITFTMEGTLTKEAFNAEVTITSSPPSTATLSATED
jgi:hypothetical protein